MENDLNRFLLAQENNYERALAEIKCKKKRSHWMWYIFPQLKGLGMSSTSLFYGIQNLDEAKAYLKHPLLGTRLVAITNELLLLEYKDAYEIFGSPDHLKLKSCMTLFSLVDGISDSVFKKVIYLFFDGSYDTNTIELIKAQDKITDIKFIEMKQPHDNWAKYYDFVYEKTFGNIYNSLTKLTIDKITTLFTKGTIIDYGAGTGRLTIPLKQKGYDLIAVEKSIGMIHELENKVSFHNLEIPLLNCSISEYANEEADFALALFTVLSYSTTEEELTKCIENISMHLKPNGFFFFDLPNRIFFANEVLLNKTEQDFKRYVTLSRTENEVYTYHEECSGIFNGVSFSYEDVFSIKYWDISKIDAILNKNGLTDTQKEFPEFNVTGSIYKLYQKK